MLKTKLVIICFSLLPLLSHATDKLTTKINHCSQQSDTRLRLACYDDIAKNLIPEEIVMENNFGKTPKAATNNLDKLYMQVVTTNKDPYGAQLITFDNGQVWKQTDSRRYKIKLDAKTFIKRGALGAFMLGQDDRNATIRVKRIQ